MLAGPNGLISQLRIMEELGKTCRDTPISIMDSESRSMLHTNAAYHRNST